MGEKIVPLTLSEALTNLNRLHFDIVCGGSDSLLQHKAISGLPPRYDNVMFIANIDELHYEKVINGEIHIGATMTLEEILYHQDTPDVLKKCIGDMANANIRHFATLPGNVANASPVGDGIVVLILLDALVKLTSIHGSRLVKISDFIVGVRQTSKEDNELIEEIIIPCNSLHTFWQKVGSRKADSISKLSFAGAYLIENNIIKDIRLAFGAVYFKVIRFVEIEQEMINLSVDELKARKEEFIDKFANAITPIDDFRSSKDYRLNVTKNIMNKFFDDIKENADELH